MIPHRSTAPRAAALCLAAAFLLTLAPGADAAGIDLVGRWPYGSTRAVAVSGSYAFYGAGGSLMVADVSTPASPQVVAHLVLPGVVHDIALVGDRAYVAAGGAGLHVVDVTDPLAPALLGSVGLPPNPATAQAVGVAVAGTHAYVAARTGGLRVIDVADPTAPVEVGALPYTISPSGTSPLARAVAVAGTTVYLADHSYGGGLRVVDVTDPTQPTQLALVEGYAQDVAVSWPYVITAEVYDGVRIYDVADPASPTQVGDYDDPLGTIEGLDLAGGDVVYAYRRSPPGDYSLVLFDVSTPSAPAEIGSTPIAGTPSAAGFASTTAFVSTVFGGLRVMDASTPSAPTEVAMVPTPGIGGPLAVAGTLAFLRLYPGDGGEFGMAVFDVADPAAPQLLGSVPLGATAWEFAVSGHLVAAALGDSGLALVDVSNPSAPTVVGTWEDGAISVAAADHWVFFNGGGLRVLDVSDPSAPQLVANVHPWVWPQDIALLGDYAYVVEGGDDFLSIPPALVAVDVSDPTSPAVAGSAVGRTFHDLDLVGPRSFGADAFRTFCELDLSNPAAPAEAGCLTDPAFPYVWQVATGGAVAYLVDHAGRLRAYDVSKPLAPDLIGDINTYSVSSNTPVVASGGLAYVSAGGAGLLVLHVDQVFADGFETGDTSAWSAAAPAAPP